MDRRKEEKSTDAEEAHGGAAVAGAVSDLLVVDELVGVVHGHNHGLHGEEGGQVRRVAADDDQGEEPPHSPHYPARRRPSTHPNFTFAHFTPVAAILTFEVRLSTFLCSRF